MVLIIPNYKGSKPRRNEKNKSIDNKLKQFCSKLSGFDLIITNRTPIHRHMQHSSDSLKE